MILLKHMKINSTSNDLIQAIQLELNKDGIFRNDYFIKKKLFVKKYDVNNLNKYAMNRFLRILCIYFSNYRRWYQ